LRGALAPQRGWSAPYLIGRPCPIVAYVKLTNGDGAGGLIRTIGSRSRPCERFLPWEGTRAGPRRWHRRRGLLGL